MSTPHATNREQEGLDAGLSPAEARLLAADSPPRRERHDPPAARPLRPDFATWGREVADRSRPHRQAREHERTERQQQIDALRSKRVYDRNLQLALDAIPDRYADAEPDHPDVLRWVGEYRTRRTRESLLLMGQVGTGKTHQAFAAFRALAIAGAGRPAAVTVPALLDGLRPHRPGEVDYPAIESADLLLLDDLAAERVTDWTSEVLTRLIDARWSSVRCTIITTNATPTDVRERLGDRIASRLAGMCRTIVMTGTDRRLTGH